jgi:hypothetical protein
LSEGSVEPASRSGVRASASLAPPSTLASALECETKSPSEQRADWISRLDKLVRVQVLSDSYANRVPGSLLLGSCGEMAREQRARIDARKSKEKVLHSDSREASDYSGLQLRSQRGVCVLPCLAESRSDEEDGMAARAATITVEGLGCLLDDGVGELCVALRFALHEPMKWCRAYFSPFAAEQARDLTLA